MGAHTRGARPPHAHRRDANQLIATRRRVAAKTLRKRAIVAQRAATDGDCLQDSITLANLLKM